MRTIALRFSDHFAPEKGTIDAHQEVIDSFGSVWFGKLGLPVSDKVASYIMNNEEPRILLIHSGKTDRYWAFVKAIQRSCPSSDMIPSYYRDDVDQFHTWFQITRFQKADKDVMSKLIVPSSGQLLSIASRQSMSPYFIIELGGV